MKRDPGQWWTESWNPVTGCTPAGAGCDRCWARAMVRRFPTLHDLWLDAKTPFSAIHMRADRLDQPLHWRKPRVVLCSALGDLFHEQVPGEFVRRVQDAIIASPAHTFCVLTKRYLRAAHFFEIGWPSNAILLASVWDEPSAMVAIGTLYRLPEGVRWGLHVEPMLGPIRFDPHALVRPAWIVCGGENGPGARPMDPQWALDLREQCRGAGVPFWWKGASRILFRGLGASTRENDALASLEQTREVPW